MQEQRWKPVNGARICLAGGNLIWPLVVAAAAILPFLPALRNEFINYDDHRLILRTYGWRGLGAAHLRWMFTTLHGQQYHPLMWLSLALDYQLWGLNPRGYHATNILIHAANAVLVYFLAGQLLVLAMAREVRGRGAAGQLRLGAVVAALFFAVHPLRAESAAWVTERRGLLCAFFYLGSILAYVQSRTTATGTRRVSLYVVALVLALCALLSKPMAVSLPLVLLVLDFYPLRRLGWAKGWCTPAARRVYLEKLPFVLAAATVSAVVAIGYQGAVVERPMAERLVVTAYGLAFYLRKTLFPVALSPQYEYRVGDLPPLWAAIISGAVIAAITFWVCMRAKRWPAGLALWAAYVCMLAPVSGVVPVGLHVAADRYAYLPCLSWALLAGGGAAWLWPHLMSRRQIGTLIGATGAAGLVLAVFGALAFHQATVWRNSRAVWAWALRLDPRSALIHTNRANASHMAGQDDMAIAEATRALAMHPGLPRAYYNRGKALAGKGMHRQAVEDFTRALEHLAPGDPHYADILASRGVAYDCLGEHEKAVTDYSEAIRALPSFAAAWYNRGLARAALKDYAGAAADFTEAIRLNPEVAEAYYNRALCYLALGVGEKAHADVRQFRALGGVLPADCPDGLR